MILYLGAGGNVNTVNVNTFDGRLDILSNFSKIVIEGIGNVR